LPKTVAPLPDELLSGWLARLAAANYCEVGELLAHVEIDARHAVTLDFELEAGAAERIAAAARVDPETVQSLTFPELTQSETLPTAQIPFQSCALCAKRGIALKHWRRVWSFGCQLCGTTLLPILAKPVAPMSEKLLRRARTGAELLEQAAWSSSSARGHRRGPNAPSAEGGNVHRRRRRLRTGRLAARLRERASLARCR
jgi:hypothetical protein